MTTERKLRWATNFFIWSAAIILMLEAFSLLDRWSRSHVPQTPSVETVAYFIGFMIGGLLRNGAPYILALINAFVLHRYKSRIAAALFVLLGLYGFASGAFILIEASIVYLAVGTMVLFGAYLAIAIWTFITLNRMHGSWSWSAFVRRVTSSLHRPDKRESEKLTDAYYSLITKAVAQLPLNEATSRKTIYDRARAFLAEQHLSNNDLERERRALDEAIRRVERRSPKETVGNPLHRATTVSLVFSLLFPGISWGWILDFTCMSLYWVARIRA